ncbi:hypothetical protein GCM10022296_24420 [Secundilactobacillus similis DSM 23365 = JCM 2765]|nr:hypothetical protein [Secundilactobacillus similis]
MNNLQEELQKLKNKFMQQLRNNSDDFSEEAVRSGYVNKMLELFGWDISDLTQIIQERKLTGNEKERLNQIESTNTKPDYELLDKGTLLEFIDTKKPGVDFEEDKKIAFQIRSYGWSAKLPFSIVTNFQKFGVYDTSYTPTSETPTDYKVCYFTIDDLINDIDKYGQFIRRENLVLGNVNISSLGIDQTKKKNEKEIDDHFLEFINRQRITLAQGIVRDNLHFSIESLNNVVQLIINRIIFVRFLEGAHIEPQNELRRLMDVGDFWQKFTELSNTRLFLEYDGAMFKKDSFKLTISDRYFEEFIDNLYVSMAM